MICRYFFLPPFYCFLLSCLLPPCNFFFNFLRAKDHATPDYLVRMTNKRIDKLMLIIIDDIRYYTFNKNHSYIKGDLYETAELFCHCRLNWFLSIEANERHFLPPTSTTTTIRSPGPFVPPVKSHQSAGHRRRSIDEPTTRRDVTYAYNTLKTYLCLLLTEPSEVQVLTE